MEEKEESNKVSGEDQMDCDDETLDPTWKPQQLQSEYDKAADDKGGGVNRGNQIRQSGAIC